MNAPWRLLIFWIATVCFLVAAGCPESGKSGADLFVLYCSGCHPGGGNTVNPLKSLQVKDLRANRIRTPEDIVEKMRNPGVGMPRFTTAMIPQRDAVKIGTYILATFR